MAEALRVHDGCPPWAPAPGAEPGEVLDRWDVPRAGLLHQNGSTFFFDCILGDGAPTGLWTFVQIDDREMADLLGVRSPADLDSIAAAVLQDRWVTVAAVDDYRILTSAVLAADEDGADGLVRRLLLKLDRIHQTRDEMHRMTSPTPA